jgi:phage-related protein
MPSTVAQLNVKVGGDTSEAEGKLKSLSGNVNSTGGFFKSALGNALSFAGAGAILGAVGGAAGFLVGQMKDVITQGMSQQKVMTETNTVLKSMGNISGQTSQSIGDYADKMAQLTGVSDDVIQHSENVMLTFANIGGKVFPEATTAALNMSTMLGTDLQGSVIQVGKALNDPIKGVSALARVGVSFSQQEKDTIAVMMQHNNIAGAQAVVMSELNKQFGGAAVAAGTTFGGQMQRLGVTMDQAKEKIGLALLPVLNKLLTAITPLITQFGNALPGAMAFMSNFVSKNVSPLIDKLASFVKGNLIPVLINLGGFILKNVVPAVVSLATWFEAHVVPILLTVFQVVKDNILPALAQVWQSIATNLIPAIEKLWNKISPILIPALQLVGWVLQHVIGPALGLVITIIGKVIDFIANLIGWVLNIGKGFSNLGTTVHNVITNVQAIFLFGLTKVREYVHAAVMFVLQKFLEAKANVELVMNTIKAILTNAWNTIVNGVRTALTNFTSSIGNAVGGIAGKMGQIKDAIAKPITDLASTAVQWGVNIIQAIINGIASMAGNIKNAVGNVLGGIGGSLHDAHIPGFAVGGVMQQTGLARVGENGPETVLLPGGSRVYPSGTGPRASGGATWNITLNGTNIGIQDLQRELWRQAVLHG